MVEEKFNLPAIILDSKTYFTGAFNLTDKVVIVSYNFAAKQELELVKISWDLVVLDEAHKLRNVYRESNKIGRALERALNGRRKILLTATPLQNSLMELYGLSLLIDPNIFGDDISFRAQYTTTQGYYKELKERLAAFCKRTLRSDVLEYIRYTKRKPITFPFVPSTKEQILYEKVSKFLQKESVYAIPYRQKHLISLILYKLLASSSLAICGTLSTMLERMEKIKAGQRTVVEDQTFDDLIIEADLEEEQEDIPISDKENQEINMGVLDKEIAEIKSYISLAQEVGTDTKTEELVKALEVGFAEMQKMGAPQKALIFTESRRTQRYLFDYLSAHGYAHQIVLFHGGNRLQRNELIRQFKNDVSIMIATEAGAEGLNMQFCSLVINYDLPWNPQRVEQRIGRCHRYGQKYDVVVINFVNQKNVADKRVFELLSSKFQLFEGVFGASDEILGAIEEGVDFENKILDIYQTCRTPEEIDKAFDNLQKEMESTIDQRLRRTKQELLRNFDADVHRRLKVNLEQTKTQLTDRQKLFWALAKEILKKDGVFDENEVSFTLENPSLGKCGKYYFLTQADKRQDMESSFIFRLSSPLGEHVIKTAKELDTSSLAEITFDVSHARKRHVYFEKMKDQNLGGWCSCSLLSIESFEKEEYIILSGIDDLKQEVYPDLLQKLLTLEVVKVKDINLMPAEMVLELKLVEKNNLDKTKQRSANRNLGFYTEESEKIQQFIKDKLYVILRDITSTKHAIQILTRQEKTIKYPDQLLILQEKILSLEKKLHHLRIDRDRIEDEINQKRKQLITSLDNQIKAKISQEKLFTFKWKLQ